MNLISALLGGGILAAPQAMVPYSNDNNPYQGHSRGGNGKRAPRKRRVSASAKGSHNRKAVLKRAKKRAVRLQHSPYRRALQRYEFYKARMRRTVSEMVALPVPEPSGDFYEPERWAQNRATSALGVPDSQLKRYFGM